MKNAVEELRPLLELREGGVRENTADLLYSALVRLLEGTFDTTLSDGNLTVVNLAAEAGVSRATANRAPTILMEMSRLATHIDEAKVSVSNPVLRVRQLEKLMRRNQEQHHATVRDLRRSIELLSQQVQLLELRCAHLQQRGPGAEPSVLPIESRRP
jgi:hypothetical protein